MDNFHKRSHNYYAKKYHAAKRDAGWFANQMLTATSPANRRRAADNYVRMVVDANIFEDRATYHLNNA